MSPKTSGWQLKYTILSTTINIMASRTLLLDVAPSKTLGYLSYHKSSFCQVLQNALHFYRTFKKYMGDDSPVNGELERQDSNLRPCRLMRLLLPVELRSNRCRVRTPNTVHHLALPRLMPTLFSGQAVTPGRRSKYI